MKRNFLIIGFLLLAWALNAQIDTVKTLIVYYDKNEYKFGEPINHLCEIGYEVRSSYIEKGVFVVVNGEIKESINYRTIKYLDWHKVELPPNKVVFFTIQGDNTFW